MIPDLGRAQNRQLNWVWRIHFKDGSLVYWQTGAGCWLENWLVRGLPLPILLQLSSPMPRVGFSQWKGWVQRKNPKVSILKGQAPLCKHYPSFFSYHMTKSRINVGLESVSTERVWFTCIRTKITLTLDIFSWKIHQAVHLRCVHNNSS